MASDMDKCFEVCFLNLSGNKKQKRVKISVQTVCWRPSRSASRSNFGAAGLSSNGKAELKFKGMRVEKWVLFELERF